MGAVLILALSFAVTALAEEVSPQSSPLGEAPSEAPTWLRSAMDSPASLANAADAAGEREAPSTQQLERSRSDFRDLSSGEAVDVAAEKFPQLINLPLNPVPPLGEGERITKYLSLDAAQLEMPNGRHAVLDSMLPLVTSDAEERLVPVDLGLQEEGETLVPRAPLVPVHIPKQAGEGIEMPEIGLTVTPTNGDGSPLSASIASATRAAADFANTQTDTDTIVKPLPLGFEIHSLLRSPKSPEKLFFRFASSADGDPTLTRADDGSVMVEANGKRIAMIPPAAAVDAAGEPVPVSMEIEGDLLALEVGHRSAEFLYPIDVDPTATDYSSFGSWEGKEGNWSFENGAPGVFTGEWQELWSRLHIANGSGNSFNYGDWASWFYLTQGVSRIYELDATVDSPSGGNFLAIAGPAGAEAETWIPISPPIESSHVLCAASECVSGGGSAGNAAVFELIATESGSFPLFANLDSASVRIVQDQAATITFNTTDPEIEGKPNALYDGGHWFKTSDEARVGFSASDPGLGISGTEVSSHGFYQWNGSFYSGILGNCVGVQCDSSFSLNRSLGNMPEGSQPVHARVFNAAISSEATKYVKLDNAGPTASLSGLGPSNIAGVGENTITVHIEDGAQANASSGVKTGESTVSLDGKQILGPGSGGCSPGPCEVSREYSFLGRDIGVGEHYLTVTATDQIGNQATTQLEFVVTANEGPMESIGPGSLNIRNGDFFLSNTDVSESAAGSSLSVIRSYESLRPQDEQGPLGPGWQLSFGAWRQLRKMPDGTAVISDNKGRQVVFHEINNGYYEETPAYPDWALHFDAEASTYRLTAPSGSATTFKQPSSSSGSLYMPAAIIKADGAISARFTFEESPTSGSIRPSVVGGPHPSGVEGECPEAAWCRELHFSYATSTSASGNGPNDWGTYDGHLDKISLAAWDHFAESYEEIPIAEYAYDTDGRLRAAWDPRISPAVKTTYGYDAAGHITAVAPSGQQPWMMHYGSAAGSSHTDWLLSASRPEASASLEGVAPLASTEQPFLSNPQPLVGKTYHVWNGGWSGDPTAYDYQWSRCDAGGNNCVPIPGASDQSYTPTGQDLDARLVASVTATNALGSATVASEPSMKVAATGTASPTYQSQFGSTGSGEGQFSQPYGIAFDPADDVWVADTLNNRIEKLGPDGEFLMQFGKEGTKPGQFILPIDVATDSMGDLWVADLGNKRIKEFNSEGQFVMQFGEEGSQPGQFKGFMSVAVDSEGAVWVTDAGNDRVQKFNSEGQFVMQFGEEGSGNGQFDEPSAVAPDSGGDLWVVDHHNDRVQEFSDKGEYLRQFGEEGSGPGKLDDPLDLGIDSVGNLWVVDRGNDRVQEFSPEGDFLTQFGEEGSGDGQFEAPGALALAPDGDIWAADTGNDRLQQWVPTEDDPTYQSQFGSTGSGEGQFSQPYGIAFDPADDVWVADTLNNRIEKLGPDGEFLMQFGKEGTKPGQFILPIDVATDSMGDLWVADLGNKRIKEFNSEGQFVMQFGEEGSQPGQFKGFMSVAVDSEGAVWVTDAGNDRVQKFNSEGQFVMQFGEEGSGNGQFDEPSAVAPDSGGDLWVVDHHNDRVQEFSDKGEYLRQFGEEGSGPGKLDDPLDLAIDSVGNLWVVDRGNDRVQEFSPEGDFLTQFGEEGSGDGQFEAPGALALAPDGDIWAADTGNDRLQQWVQFEPAQNEPPPPDSSAAVWTVIYNVSLAGSAAPYKMNSNTASEWGQGTLPTDAAAIFPPDEVPTNRHPSDYRRATVYYMDEGGRIVNTLAPGSRISTEEYDEFGNVVRTLTPENRARALEAGAESAAVSQRLDTQLAYSEDGMQLLSVLGPEHKVELDGGEEVEARLHTKYSYDEGAPEQGGPYGLVTKQTEGALVGAAEIDVRTKTFGYDGQEGLGWELRKPTSETIDPGGLSLTTKTFYEPNSGNIVETRMPGNPEGGDAHATQTLYYTSGPNEGKTCGYRPEWIGLACETRPAAQPGTAGLPDLPVTKTTYNIYNEPLESTETVGEASRTATIEYDDAGRPVSASIASTGAKALPTVHTTYDEATGLPTVQSTETEAIVSEYDSLGRLTDYTDADGNTSTYAYDVLGRVTEAYDGKGAQTFEYDATTGDLAKVDDSAVGAFTAEYDAGGKMTAMDYPNGLQARYSYDPSGSATGLEYVKASGCSENCTWFEEQTAPSVHGETMSASGTVADLNYTYDAAGRLTKSEESPQGKGCTTRLYGYDADTNRTSMTTREPTEGGACATSGGETQTTAFDAADRLIGEGVEYDEFGNVTHLPGADAGGKPLSSTYYADNTAASLSQDGTTVEYMLDPSGRRRQTLTSDGEGESSIVSHFAGDGDSPAWTEANSGSWTRYIGCMGGLAATQSSTEGLEFQVANLHGDVIGTMGSEAEELVLVDGSTEYGSPSGEAQLNKYGWLGAAQRPTELDSGVIGMGARTYVPQIGRFLQTDPVPGGSANAYTYVFGDPVGESDPSGEYTPGGAPSWLVEFMENPPGMPPPPPPPAVEDEIEELVSGGGNPLGGGQPDFFSLTTSEVMNVVQYLKSFFERNYHVAWNTCIPQSELGIKYDVLREAFGTICIPKLRFNVTSIPAIQAAKSVGYVWCLLVHTWGVQRSAFSFLYAAASSAHFCGGNGGERAWAYVKVY